MLTHWHTYIQTHWQTDALTQKDAITLTHWHIYTLVQCYINMIPQSTYMLLLPSIFVAITSTSRHSWHFKAGKKFHQISPKPWSSASLSSYLHSPYCTCSSFIDITGGGDCRTQYKGRPWCYVEYAQCDDVKTNQKGSLWSSSACERNKQESEPGSLKNNHKIRNKMIPRPRKQGKPVTIKLNSKQEKKQQQNQSSVTEESPADNQPEYNYVEPVYEIAEDYVDYVWRRKLVQYHCIWEPCIDM